MTLAELGLVTKLWSKKMGKKDDVAVMWATEWMKNGILRFLSDTFVYLLLYSFIHF